MSPELLTRLGEYVAGVLGTAPPSRDVGSWLYETATRDDLPKSLRETFDGVAALASEDGTEVLLGTGHDRGVDLARDYGPRSPADLAVLACLDHPKAFGDARAQVRAVNHRMFAVYMCEREDVVSRAELAQKVPWVQRSVSDWLRSKGRPDCCRAIVTQSGEQLVLDVVTQRAPGRCVTPEGGEVLASWKRQDTLVFECGGRSVSIHARCESEVEFYRSLAGLMLCDDSEAYRATHVFHLRRLLCPEEWACWNVTAPGLANVMLRGVEVRSGARRTRWRGETCLSKPERAMVEMLESADQCTRVELDLHIEGRVYPCPLEILPPNRICLDQRAIGTIASSYLKAQGLFIAA